MTEAGLDADRQQVEPLGQDVVQDLAAALGVTFLM